MASACAGQTATQFSQATQSSLVITGLGHSVFIFGTVFPSRQDRGRRADPAAGAAFVQRDAEIRCGCFFSPVMAETGHNLMQAPQPVHNSVIA